jgi:hypothetical protein
LIFYARFYRFKRGSHLASAAARRIDDIQMRGRGDNHFAVKFEINNDAYAPAQPFFRRLKIILASRQSNDLRVGRSVSGQDSVAVKRRKIFARQFQLFANAFGHLKVFDAKNRAGANGAAQLKRDVAIAGTKHPIVKFIQQQKVCEAKHRMRVQDFDYSIKPRAALDVPLDDSQKRAQSRLNIRRFVNSRLVKQTLQLGLARLIKIRTAKFVNGGESLKLFCQMLIACDCLPGSLGARGFHYSLSAIPLLNKKQPTINGPNLTTGRSRATRTGSNQNVKA